jgi:ubiquinone/menaquinone biosynthesis C-methylase UbiE
MKLDSIIYDRVVSHIKLLHDFLSEHFDPSITVLDIGCGKGVYFQYYNQLGIRNVIGIDIDRKALRESKSQYTNVSFIVADALNIPLRSSSIDVVVLAEVLEHLNSPETCLKECHRILKEKGIILASVPWLYEIYRPLSAIILRALTVFKRTGKKPLLLRILFTIDGDVIKRRKVFSPLVEYLWKFAKRMDKSFYRLYGPSVEIPKSPEEYILMHRKGLLFNDQHKVFMTPKEWADTIKAMGFNVNIDGTFSYPPLLWRFRIMRVLLNRISRSCPRALRAWLSQTLIIVAQKQGSPLSFLPFSFPSVEGGQSNNA